MSVAIRKVGVVGAGQMGIALRMCARWPAMMWALHDIAEDRILAASMWSRAT